MLTADIRWSLHPCAKRKSRALAQNFNRAADLVGSIRATMVEHRSVPGDGPTGSHERAVEPRRNKQDIQSWLAWDSRCILGITGKEQNTTSPAHSVGSVIIGVGCANCHNVKATYRYTVAGQDTLDGQTGGDARWADHAPTAALEEQSSIEVIAVIVRDD